jgi:hypothetical protein
MERSVRCVVTFPTTTAALTLERACMEENVPGRLVPTPRSVTAHCGLSWSAPQDARESLEKLVIARGIQIDGVYRVRM